MRFRWPHSLVSWGRKYAASKIPGFVWTCLLLPTNKIYCLGIINRLEWLWNSSDSFVLCFCGPDGVQRTCYSIPSILIFLTSKYVPLIYFVTICQKTKDCAPLFLYLMFVVFHNQSPLITTLPSVSKNHRHLVRNSCSLTCTCCDVSEVKRSHLFDSKRVVAQKESQLFENLF